MSLGLSGLTFHSYLRMVPSATICSYRSCLCCPNLLTLQMGIRSKYLLVSELMYSPNTFTKSSPPCSRNYTVTPVYSLLGTMGEPSIRVALTKPFLVQNSSGSAGSYTLVRLTTWRMPSVKQNPSQPFCTLLSISTRSAPRISKAFRQLSKGNMLWKCWSWITPGYQVDRNAPWLMIEKSAWTSLDSQALIISVVIRLASEFSWFYAWSSKNSLSATFFMNFCICGMYLSSNIWFTYWSACTVLSWNTQEVRGPALMSSSSVWNQQVRLLAKIFSQTGMGPSMAVPTTLRVTVLKWKYITLKQQPPSMEPMKGMFLYQWWANSWRCPQRMPSMVPSGSLSIKSITSSSSQGSCMVSLVLMSQVLFQGHLLPKCASTTMIQAPLLRSSSAYRIVMAGYSRNEYLGNLPEMNPDVVVGVSVVASPMTPILMPLSSKISVDFWLGRKLASPFSEYKLAASDVEFLALRQLMRNYLPQSNQWLPIAEAFRSSEWKKSAMISPLLACGPASTPPWYWSPVSRQMARLPYSSLMMLSSRAMQTSPPYLYCSLLSVLMRCLGKAVPWMSLVPIKATVTTSGAFWNLPPNDTHPATVTAATIVMRSFYINYYYR